MQKMSDSFQLNYSSQHAVVDIFMYYVNKRLEYIIDDCHANLAEQLKYCMRLLPPSCCCNPQKNIYKVHIRVGCQQCT